MLSLLKPSPQSIQRFLDIQGNKEFSYSAVGATKASPPAGYVVDHARVKLSSGQQVYDEAQDSLRKSELARRGFWWLNAFRIVYIVDEQEPASRFGFAYGTLAAHRCPRPIGATACGRVTCRSRVRLSPAGNRSRTGPRPCGDDAYDSSCPST